MVENMDFNAEQQTRFDLFIYQRRIMAILLAWGLGSMVGGWLWWHDRSSFLKGLGGQFWGWGFIDALLAIGGLRSAAKKEKQLTTGDLPTDKHRREKRNLTRLLMFNGCLDMLYMLGGDWLVRRAKDKPQQRGAGWGIIIQAAFLFVFDWLAALLLARQEIEE
jgi:hypothetical protein